MVESCWVVNASPIIALAKINRLDLLLRGSGTLVIPEAVVDEIQAGPVGDPARTALAGGFGGVPAPVSLRSLLAAPPSGLHLIAIHCHPPPVAGRCMRSRATALRATR